MAPIWYVHILVYLYIFGSKIQFYIGQNLGCILLVETKIALPRCNCEKQKIVNKNIVNQNYVKSACNYHHTRKYKKHSPRPRSLESIRTVNSPRPAPKVKRTTSTIAASFRYKSYLKSFFLQCIRISSVWNYSKTAMH